MGDDGHLALVVSVEYEPVVLVVGELAFHEWRTGPDRNQIGDDRSGAVEKLDHLLAVPERNVDLDGLDV